jgi:hypothetical protein
MEYGTYPGKYPAFVESYDKTTRQVRVSIPGITDGKDVFPLAEIAYPVGDKSRIVEGQHPTEIEILPGDHIWVEFIGGDERYPLITGYRNPNAPSSNSIDWRRWHHANIEMIAEGILRLIVGGSTITINPTSITLAIGTSTIVMTSANIQITADRVDIN